MSSDCEKIEEFLTEVHAGSSSASNPFESYRIGFEKMVRKFGRNGHKYLKRIIETNPIHNSKWDAAVTAAREYEDNEQFGRASRTELRANMALGLSMVAILVTVIEFFS